MHEGDDFHPQQNIEKMIRGEPLTDEVSVCVRVLRSFTTVMSESSPQTCSGTKLNK